MRRLIPLFLTVVLAGCSVVRVQNASDSSVTVQVSVPDRSGSVTRVIRAGEVSDFISEHGGSYSVGTIPGQTYLSSLRNLRTLISGRLFEEHAALSGAEVARLVENMNAVDQMLEQARSNADGAYCRGRLPDMDSAVAVISFDESTGRYVISCS